MLQRAIKHKKVCYENVTEHLLTHWMTIVLQCFMSTAFTSPFSQHTWHVESMKIPYQYFTDCCTWPSNKHNSYHSWNDWYDNECIVITSHCGVTHPLPCYLPPPACLLWTFPSKNMYLQTSVKVVATDTSHVTWQVFVSLCSTYEFCDWKWLNNFWPYYICNCFAYYSTMLCITTTLHSMYTYAQH